MSYLQSVVHLVLLLKMTDSSSHVHSPSFGTDSLSLDLWKPRDPSPKGGNSLTIIYMVNSFKKIIANAIFMALLILICVVYGFGLNIFLDLFGSMYASFNPLYLIGLPYKVAMQSSGSMLIAFLSTIFFLRIFIANKLFRKRVLTVSFYPVILLLRFLKWVVLKLKWEKQPPSKWKMVFRSYRRFLSHYYERMEFWNIMRTHGEFLLYLAFPPLLSFYPISGSWRARKETFFENRNLLVEMQDIIRKALWESSFISNFINIASRVWFSVHASKMTGDEAEKKIKGIIGEATRILPGYNPVKETFSNEVLIQRDTISVMIERKPVWNTSIVPNLKDLMDVIPEGMYLVGYSAGETPTNVFVPIKNIQHQITVSQTWWWKDIQTNNILYSTLVNKLVSKFPVRLFLFDSKNVDFLPFCNREQYYIHHFQKKDGQFAQKFEDLVSKMRAITNKVWKYGNVDVHDKAHPKEAIGHTYIFVNEVLSLFSNDSSDETKRISSALITLLAEWRASWFHIFLLSQSLRGDILKGSFGRIRVGLDSIYAGRTVSKLEANILGNGLSESDKERLLQIPKHVFLLIQWGEILAEAKPYMIDAIHMEAFLDEYFPRKVNSSDKQASLSPEDELADLMRQPMILSYLVGSTVSWVYHWWSAQKAGISEPTFRKLQKILNTLWYLELRPWLVARVIKPIIEGVEEYKNSSWKTLQ